jgi:hypothetical protein
LFGRTFVDSELEPLVGGQNAERHDSDCAPSRVHADLSHSHSIWKRRPCDEDCSVVRAMTGVPLGTVKVQVHFHQD